MQASKKNGSRLSLRAIDRVPKWAWLQVAVTSPAVASYSDDVM